VVEAIFSETLTEKAYRAIKTAVLHSELLPGQTLSIEELAERLGTSQTPVREALAKLVTEGLVEQGSNKRLYVTRIGEKDVRETYEVRRLLEPYVASQVASSLAANPHLAALLTTLEADNEAIRKIASQRDKLTLLQHKKYMDIDLQLNNTMLKGVNNSLLAEVFDFVSNRSLRIRSYAEVSMEESEIVLVREVTKEHTKIIRALLSGDPDQAEKTVKDHLDNAEQRTLRALYASATTENP